VPDIIMGDGLYFNEPVATEIHKLGSDFLFKVITPRPTGARFSQMPISP